MHLCNPGYPSLTWDDSVCRDGDAALDELLGLDDAMEARIVIGLATSPTSPTSLICAPLERRRRQQPAADQGIRRFWGFFGGCCSLEPGAGASLLGGATVRWRSRVLVCIKSFEKRSRGLAVRWISRHKSASPSGTVIIES